MTLYFHSWQYLVRGWLYRDIIFSPLTIFSEGVNISWHYIFTHDNNWWGVIISWHYIFTHWQYLVRGVIISWHYIFTPDNIWLGGEYIVTLYFHSWQYLVMGWLYRDIIFSPLTISSEGVNISWHYIFTPDNIWWGGEYIVTLYFHFWQYLVRGWLYRDIIFSLLTIIGQGVIISWHNILTPDNIKLGGDYIVPSYFHSWQYFVRGWLYCDMIFSPLTIFGQGGDYIVTLYLHSWQYLVRGWLYCDIIFSLLTISGEGVIISFTYFHSWRYLVRGWLYRDITISFLTLP